MTSPLAVPVAFCVLLIACNIVAGMIDDWAWSKRRTAFVALSAVALMIVCAYALTVTPSPDSLPRAVEEPWPTETPWTCNDLMPWVHTLLDQVAQGQHHVEELGLQMDAIATYIWRDPTNTPEIPDSTPTPTPAPIMCRRCEYESECGEGYKCYRCSDGLGRCVRREMPNGDCQNCVNAGLP